MKNLKEATREHFDDVSMSVEQLDSLMAVMATKSPPEESVASAPSSVTWMKVLVVAVILLGIGLAVFALRPDDRSTLIAQEVAYNHKKLKPLEVTTGALPEVARYFASHQIKVVENSSVLDAFKWDLQGGRFCSIQGTDAAQLRYKTKSDEIVSVYMAPYTPSTMGELPVVEKGEVPLPVVSNGNEVWIWVEQNQVIATTVPVED